MKELHLWPNNEKQQMFLADMHPYVGFGGAKGGGKSWAVDAKAIKYAFKYPGVKIKIVRRSYPMLYENHIPQMIRMLDGIAKYNDSRKEHRFPNKSLIMYRYCMSKKDIQNFQGNECDVMFIDEATHFLEEEVTEMISCVRGANDFPKQTHITCNPGGRGHAWVKRKYIDCNFDEYENPDDYSFIKSLLDDNIALMKNDPNYEKRLRLLPPKQYQAYRFGDWDIFEGQFFEEFRNDPANYDTHINTHVINPFTIDGSWKIIRSYDHGYNKPFACSWYAINHDDTMFNILEKYGCTKTPNEGVRWPTEKVFSEIKKFEGEHEILRRFTIDGVADPACWQRDGNGPSIADTAAKQGVYFDPGDNKRISGWAQVHNRLAFDENGRAKLYFWNNCRGMIRTLPLLVYSDTRPEDLDTFQEDHLADELRYACALNPTNPPPRKAPPPKPYDPLEIDWTNEAGGMNRVLRV